MNDTILQGLLKHDTIRFAAITGRELVTEAQCIHALSRTATAALGRELLMVAMMAGQLKNDTDSVSAILSGGGPGGNLVCVGRKGPFVKGCAGDPACELPPKPNGKLDVGGYVGRKGPFVKGCAGDPACELPPKPNGKLDVGGYVGRNGKLTVVRDLSLKEPYVGMCHLISGEVAEDFAEYFTASEQQPSLVYLGVRLEPLSGQVLGAGGLLIQPLPDCPAEHVDYVMTKAEAIPHLTERLSEGENLRDIVLSLFPEGDVSFTEELHPAYRCDCSRERMERALMSLGREELSEIIEEDGQAELSCHFCNSKYTFTKAELLAILREGAQA